MGSDRCTFTRQVTVSSVSIHAPTWGATQSSKDKEIAALFQSTLPHGERHDERRANILANEFQSTLPHGERQDNHCPCFAINGFNPRSHMGSDMKIKLFKVNVYVSIHAPTWGATTVLCQILLLRLFQSTLPHGERHHQVSSWSSGRCFNPRSHMGSDVEVVVVRLSVTLFQSTLPHGERLKVTAA